MKYVDLKRIAGFLMLAAAYVQSKPEVLDGIDDPWRSLLWRASEFALWLAAGGYIAAPRQRK